MYLCLRHRHYITQLNKEHIDIWQGLHALFWLSNYVASLHLAVAPQSGTKDQFYFPVYYITLNSNCEARRVSKNLKTIVEDTVGSKNKCMGNLSVIFLHFKDKIMFKNH